MNHKDSSSHGLHHVTAIATDPQRNVDFYVDLLGLRLVKRTVNFDDPGTYHLYYGDGVGTPGTIMTFFPWPGARRGAVGPGMTRTTAFAVPEDSLGWWRDRLTGASVVVGEIEERFDEAALPFLDPDGLRLELVASADAPSSVQPWDGADVEPAHAIRGFHGVTLLQRDPEATAEVLTGLLGYASAAERPDRLRFSVDGDAPGRHVDLLIDDGAVGRVAAGTVHHVAFRAADGRQQQRVRSDVEGAGLQVSPVLDRQYFESIYFREPGGVLFEVATDPPGFARDESVEELGRGLKLPPWFEDNRDQIEAALPELRVSSATSSPESRP